MAKAEGRPQAQQVNKSVGRLVGNGEKSIPGKGPPHQQRHRSKRGKDELLLPGAGAEAEAGRRQALVRLRRALLGQG